MKNQDYHSSITTDVTPEEAFDKICRVSEWWASRFEGESRELNDVFTVLLGDTFVTFRVAEIAPGKRAVWEVTDCYLSWLNDKTEWKGTKIVWEIFTPKNATQIDMTHLGLVPGIECYNDCKIGWDDYIQKSLAKFLTENKGLPDEF